MTDKARIVKRGKVLSDKMNKTVVIAIERIMEHEKYKKSFKRTTKLYAHDENNECRIDDIVEVYESRPISKTKRWIFSRIIKKATI